MTARLALAVAGGLLAAVGAAAPAGAAEPTSCTTCHADPDLFEEEALAAVRDYVGDVHAEVGLGCHDCHGGNPDPALADDMFAAKDEGWAANPYRGAPAAGEVPGFCARCHSDPAYMRRFRPAPRVDQEREYWTSQHGVALAGGDERVATCVSCHGVHGIRRATDPDSTVHPTRVADTCRGCHGDAERMAGYRLPDGRPLPVDQYARWRQSVHAAALLEREDLSAPTCNDCHGNHGAMPPGLDAVTYVCGQCHGREASIFRASPKHRGFVEHNEYLQDAGEESCAACHEEPQASVTGLDSFSECSTCHGNHGVVRPTVALFSALPETPCAFCHEARVEAAGEPGAGASAEASAVEDDEAALDPVAALVPEPEASRRRYLEVRDGLLATAAESGLTGAELFDWLVDAAATVEAHDLPGSIAEGAAPQLRPEFERLFEKFRIGKTHYTYEDPVTGAEVRAGLRRCGTCHEPEDLAETPDGVHHGSTEMVARMHELTALTARAERILLRARRGGVETREALLEVDAAVDAQIGLEVLVHGFSVAEDGEFMKQHGAGMQHARAALDRGQAALDELSFRHRGLWVALGLVVLALVALALKIRDVSESESRAAG